VIERVLFALTLLAALGSGLIAGFFFAFSFVVMQSLDRLPVAQGIAAMQFINVVVINRWFLGVFLGTAAACAGLSVGAVLLWRLPGAFLLLVGSAFYLVGTFIVTMAFNVPRNNALAAAVPDSAAGAALWSDYLVSWTAWNHVRTAGALTAALFFILAFCQQCRGADAI
jgi:uncharacterized membrane protein